MTLPAEIGRGTTFLTVPFQRGGSQVLEKDIPGWQKICSSKGQRKSYNSKFPKVNALRKRRWGLQSEEACLTFSPGGDGKALVTLLTRCVLTLSIFPSHKVLAFIHFLSHHLISDPFGVHFFLSFSCVFFLLLLLFLFFVLFCFVLLISILGLLSYTIKDIILKMTHKTDLSLEDLLFNGRPGKSNF